MNTPKDFQSSELSNYCGLVLKGGFSPELSSYLETCISALRTLELSDAIDMTYISAWREGEENIWYEYVSKPFSDLFQCRPSNFRDLFQRSIMDRRIYRYSDSHVDAGVKHEILTSSELKRIRKDLRNEARDRGVLEAIYKVRLPDGRIRWLKDSARIRIYESDKICLSIGSLVDVSKEMRMEDELERRVAARTRRLEKMEAQLRQAQKLEALGTLAGGIAHDFNNLLTAMLGYAQLAMIESDKPTPKREYLREILNAGERAEDLVRQILAFSRRTEQALQPLIMEPIVKEVVKLLKASLPSTIDIRLNTAGQYGIVKADPTQIHQVLLNLCTNAAHAMRDSGGEMEVSLCDMDVGEQEAAFHHDLHPGPYVRMSVGDTGHGMSPDVLQRVFDPYFTTKKPGEGTGLGLSVVHGIVESHGGAIAATSEPGAGSTFHVFLPRITAEIPQRREPDILLKKGRGRILLADEDEALAVMGRRMMEHLGYDVAVRTTSAEALALFQSEPDGFDAVIADVNMSRIGESRLVEKIMAIRPETPVILFSGY
ncbi:MAG: response regulator, partial [Deltaproteobacteria bacterium]|nr:response regulator [Deltaproteobacteria bacterium]